MSNDGSAKVGTLAAERPAEILIVDDNETNLILLAKMLQKHGYKPATASDGREGFSLATTRQFDLILMDIMMPGVDGLELTRAIRNSESSTHPIIVAVTADVTEENRQACFLAGVDDFLPKPVDFTKVTKLIETWVRGPA